MTRTPAEPFQRARQVCSFAEVLDGKATALAHEAAITARTGGALIDLTGSCGADPRRSAIALLSRSTRASSPAIQPGQGGEVYVAPSTVRSHATQTMLVCRYLSLGGMHTRVLIESPKTPACPFWLEP